MVGTTASPYERDFVRWTEEQAVAPRDTAQRSTNLPLDWENLAEEIDRALDQAGMLASS
jgi:Domain of unknown function DUF29